MSYSALHLLTAAAAGAAAGAAGAVIVLQLTRRRPRAPQPAPLDETTRQHLRRALYALETMQRSAHAYKALADRLALSLDAARADAEQARQAADEAEQRFRARTAQNLAAGCSLVFDHGDTRRGTTQKGPHNDC